MEALAQQKKLASVVSKVTQIQEELVEREIEKYDTAIMNMNGHHNNNNNNDDDDDDTSAMTKNNTNDTRRPGSGDDDDPVLQQWRQKRMMEYQIQQQEIRKCQQTYGHGEYLELQNNTSHQTIDVATSFFDTCKDSTRVVLHCYRPTTELCTIFHKHLQLLSSQHVETRFVKLNVQDYDDATSTSKQQQQRGANGNIGMKFLVERLQIRVMPTLILIHNQQIVHRIEGCTELNNTTTFTTKMLGYVLGHKYKMIYPTPDEIPDKVFNPSNTDTNRSRNSKYLTGKMGSTRYRYNNHDDDDDEDDGEDF